MTPTLISRALAQAPPEGLRLLLALAHPHRYLRAHRRPRFPQVGRVMRPCRR